MISLREMAPNFKRPVKSAMLRVMAPLAFVLTSLAAYWAKWPTTVEVIGVIFLGIPLYLLAQYVAAVKSLGVDAWLPGLSLGNFADWQC